MPDSIQKYNNEESIERMRLEIDIAKAIHSRQASTADEIVELFDIEFMDAVRLLNNPDFLEIVMLLDQASYNIAKAKYARGHLLSVNKLIDTIENGELKDAMQAIRDLAKISGKVKEGVELNVHLERMLDEAHEKKVGSSSTYEQEDVTDLFPDERGAYGKR
jgi:hypothetical protein